MPDDLLGYHVVVRPNRDARMATVFTSDDEAPARTRYQLEADQAKAGARVDLRDRLGRCLASYLAPSGAATITLPRPHSTHGQTHRRTKP